MLGDAHHWDPQKRQAFQNDVLIALTARCRHGAMVVTANKGDFELLRKELAVGLFLV